jgi:hypothetical protein
MKPTEKQLKEIRKEAIDILEHGDPLAFMLDTFNESHKGDRQNAEVQIVSFGGQAACNSQGIYPKWTGGSGKGKSDGVAAIVRQLPPEYVIASSITPKSLYYRSEAGEMMAGTVIFLDDQPIQADSDLESTLKRAHTNFQEGAEHETIIKGKWVKTKLSPRTMFIRTTVEDKSDIQLKNRESLARVDESPETDKEVETLIFALSDDGKTSKDITRNVLICREMWSIIKSKVFRVKTLIASKVVKLSDPRNRRNPAYFTDLVIGVACINHMQRYQEPELGENGEIIIHASYEDFIKAAELFNAQKDYLGTKMEPHELTAIRFVHSGGIDGVSLAEISLELISKHPCGKWNLQKVARLMDGRKDRGEPGLIDTVAGLEKFEESQQAKYDGEHYAWPVKGGRPTKKYRMNQEVDLGITVEILPEPIISPTVDISVSIVKCAA